MNEAANKGGLIAYAQTMCVEERARSGNLLQRVSDAIKRPFYRGAGGVHSDDDRDRNSSSDETILDGGRARVVPQETRDKLIHLRVSGVTV